VSNKNKKKMKIVRPTEKEFDVNSYQNRYIQAVSGDDALLSLKENLLTVESFLKNIPEEKLDYRYAEGKWSIKEILGHIIDTEKVLVYRALSTARGDKQSLLGFDEELFAANSNLGKKSLRSLLLQFKTQRKSTIQMFNSFGNRELSRMGLANGLPTNARVLAWFIAGHELHHINIIKERYLIQA
jgi:uncharacterized damage-inducible protein DinB